MKYLLIPLVFLLSCSKEEFKEQPLAVRWGTVTDKFYTDSFPFVGGQYRRFWVMWSVDTTCPPFNNCGRIETRRIPQSSWDTIFSRRYPERLADNVFIPAYPY